MTGMPGLSRTRPTPSPRGGAIHPSSIREITQQKAHVDVVPLFPVSAPGQHLLGQRHGGFAPFCFVPPAHQAQQSTVRQAHEGPANLYTSAPHPRVIWPLKPLVLELLDEQIRQLLENGQFGPSKWHRSVPLRRYRPVGIEAGTSSFVREWCARDNRALAASLAMAKSSSSRPQGRGKTEKTSIYTHSFVRGPKGSDLDKWVSLGVLLILCRALTPFRSPQRS